jgi:hypothetical protein
MSLVLTILNIITVVLGILKQIPETSGIANEVSAFEVAFQNVLTAAQAADAKAKASVDPTQLGTITPIA